MELFYEVFHAMPRQGPGMDRCTLQAFNQLKPLLPPKPIVLDMGCGTGASTLALAPRCGHITAMDLDAVMLKLLADKAADTGLSDRVRTTRASMSEPDFPNGTFDLVWSEGAIYNIGFEAGLKRWRRLLKPGGCMAVTEACWLTPERPAEIARWWHAEYPAIMETRGNLAVIEPCGYRIVDHFTLPTEAWNENYYHHMKRSMDAMLKRHGNSPDARAVHEMFAEEIRMYETYLDHYGYVFFLMQRTD